MLGLMLGHARLDVILRRMSRRLAVTLSGSPVVFARAWPHLH